MTFVAFDFDDSTPLRNKIAGKNRRLKIHYFLIKMSLSQLFIRKD